MLNYAVDTRGKKGRCGLQILVLQGPNLSRLGIRKPEIYGTRTLSEIQNAMDRRAKDLGCSLDHFQSNSEGALIDWLQERQDAADAIICNPAGLTNYGLSLRDALVEAERDLAIVHLSNVHAREQWRRHDRSEERRVGKECRSRWSPYH